VRIVFKRKGLVLPFMLIRPKLCFILEKDVQ